jgi:hypothetical protein
MPDASYLDNKYFIDETVYNCPFCNRRNVAYQICDDTSFDWTWDKICYVYLVKCRYCNKESMHLSYESICETKRSPEGYQHRRFKAGIDIDSKIFYSVPTSFFVLDDRIPAMIRELITEAEGCLKMNFLTGASACARKAIYELLILEKAEGTTYESRIKFLKTKYPNSDPEFFDILGHIQDLTSDKVHEQSWPKWDSPKLRLVMETLKNVLFDIYVYPQLKRDRSSQIQQLRKTVEDRKKGSVPSAKDVS